MWRALARRGRGADATALTVLAVAAGLFTALLEALWIWAYHAYPPAGTLANNFSLDLGVAPAWQVLGLGLLMAAAALAREMLGFRRAGAIVAGARDRKA
jgi:hypothetical protein